MAPSIRASRQLMSNSAAQRTTAQTASPPNPPMSVAVGRGVRADLAAGRVELDSAVCIESGWLEQVACTPGTREHEALVVVKARPRDVHAALLLVGLEPGAPGSWRVDGEALVSVPPRGPRLRVLFRWVDGQGQTHEHSPAEWIRDVRTATSPPIEHWLFAGSLLQPMDGGSFRYEADGSGSVVGLVTFGDEVVALPEVRPDAESVLEPEWEAWTERLPPVGTRVLLILEEADGSTPAR